MTSVAVLLLALFAGAETPERTAVTRDAIEAMHTAMAARLKRDPAGVATFYTPTAAVVDDGRRHVGAAAVYALWSNTPSSAEWTQEIFDLGGGSGALWVAGRSVMSPATGMSIERFFIRLLRRDMSGELRIQFEARSSRRGTSTYAEAESTARNALDAIRTKEVGLLTRILNDGYLSVSPDGVVTKPAFLAQLYDRPPVTPADTIDDVRARLFGALAVVTGVVRAPERSERELTSIWLQTGQGWKMAALQLQ